LFGSISSRERPFAEPLYTLDPVKASKYRLPSPFESVAVTPREELMTSLYEKAGMPRRALMLNVWFVLEVFW
jgi:hypothetical protein